jgi:hypothetical protein
MKFLLVLIGVEDKEVFLFVCNTKPNDKKTMYCYTVFRLVWCLLLGINRLEANV